MTLIAEAERAEDTGDAFAKFRGAVDVDQAAEVTALVAELYAVGSVLREIDIAIHSPEHGRNVRYIEDDLELVRSSLMFTLDDVFKILGKIANGNPHSAQASYRLTWREIVYYFQRDGWGRLCPRLEKYRLFLLAVCTKLKRSVYRF